MGRGHQHDTQHHLFHHDITIGALKYATLQIQTCSPAGRIELSMHACLPTPSSTCVGTLLATLQGMEIVLKREWHAWLMKMEAR